MKKLDYFDLISPDPIRLDGVGYIKCPTLRDISRLPYKNRQYSSYLSILQLDMETYLDKAGSEYSKQLYESDKSINIYDILILDDHLREMLHNAFSFFICSDVLYSDEHKSFIIVEKDDKDEISIIGAINNSNYNDVSDCILQMNFVNKNHSDDDKYGSEKARKIAEKLRRLKQKSLSNKSDKDMNLGNLISSLALRQDGLNINNIWDITVFQFYDQFYKQNYINTIDIRAMNYSYWGGEFSPTDWFKDIRND